MTDAVELTEITVRMLEAEIDRDTTLVHSYIHQVLAGTRADVAQVVFALASMICSEIPRDCGHPDCPLVPLVFTAGQDGTWVPADIESAPAPTVAFARIISAVSTRDGQPMAVALFDAFVTDATAAHQLLQAAVTWSAPVLEAAYERHLQREQQRQPGSAT